MGVKLFFMKYNQHNKPTDEGLKNYNPSNRYFERTEEETDRVSQSEAHELKREKEKANRKKQ